MKKSENSKRCRPTHSALPAEQKQEQTNTADHHQQPQSIAKKGTKEYPSNSGQKYPKERISLGEKRRGLHWPRKN
jgi:hypothetical protein